MGQSINPPSRDPSVNSRFHNSARSLHRLTITNRTSQIGGQNRRVSLDLSRASDKYCIQPDVNSKNGQLNILSRYEQTVREKRQFETFRQTIKQQNSLEIHKNYIANPNQVSQQSPNFRELNTQPQVQYEILEYQQVTNHIRQDCLGVGKAEAINVSRQDANTSHVFNLSREGEGTIEGAHHDVTISFSKTRYDKNPFNHQENQEKKENLKHILEYQHEGFQSQRQKSNVFSGNRYSQRRQTVDRTAQRQVDLKIVRQEIDKITALSSVCSNQSENIGNVSGSEKSKPKKKIKSIKKVSSLKEERLQQKSEVSPIQNEGFFNDYDCSNQPNFTKKSKLVQMNGGLTGAKNDEILLGKNKISKNLLELKQKLDTKICNSSMVDLKLRNSIRSLSRSFKNLRSHELINELKTESQSKGQKKLRKVHLFDIKIQGDKSHQNLFANSNVEKYQIANQSKNSQNSNSPQKKDSRKQEIIMKNNAKEKNIQLVFPLKKTKDNSIGVKQGQKYLQNNVLKSKTKTKQKCSEQHNNDVNEGEVTAQSNRAREDSRLKDSAAQLFIFNGNNTYIYQNITIKQDQCRCQQSKILRQAKDEKKLHNINSQTSIKNIMKKLHYGNKLKQKGEEGIKFSEIQNKVKFMYEQNYASTCQDNFKIRKLNVVEDSAQEYQFYDGKNMKKQYQRQFSGVYNEQKIQHFTLQLTGNTQKIVKDRRIRQQKSKSSSQPNFTSQIQKDKNTGFGSLTAINYNQLIGNFQEYMLRDALGRCRHQQPKPNFNGRQSCMRRHRSSQQSSRLGRSKLLIF